MRFPTFIAESKRRMVSLCEAVGLDPDRVIDVEWHADHPKMARFTVQDGPMLDDRHVEERLVPEWWLS